MELCDVQAPEFAQHGTNAVASDAPARARGPFRRARFDGTGCGEPYRMHVHGRALRCRDCGSRLAGRAPNGSPARPRIVAVRWDWPGHRAQRKRAGARRGLEAAARQARYDERLCAAARESGAIAVLLAHTMDDQAETVLIGLLRRIEAWMRCYWHAAGLHTQWRDFARPLLTLTRDETTGLCEDLGAGILG